MTSGARHTAGRAHQPGKPHHYHFTAYALDSTINLTGKRDGRMLAEALAGHILAKGETVGTYRRA